MRPPEPPQCPNCTYPLEGLRARRCPECGFELHELLFTRPELARARPAWERRPRVGFINAVGRTLLDITVHPRRFFASMQHPDRLDRAVRWLLLLGILTCALNCAATLVRHWCSGLSPGRFGVDTLTYYARAISDSIKLLLQGVLLVGAPVFMMLVIADLLLWRDRFCFRLFAKGAIYALTVHVWTLTTVAIVWQLLRECRRYGWLRLPMQQFVPPWINWIIVAFATWYFGMLCYCLLGGHFAILSRSRRSGRARLCMAVIGGWAIAMYLTLFDGYLGFRFPPVWWSQSV